jgi:hypothetical protein
MALFSSPVARSAAREHPDAELDDFAVSRGGQIGALAVEFHHRQTDYSHR